MHEASDVELLRALRRLIESGALSLEVDMSRLEPYRQPGRGRGAAPFPFASSSSGASACGPGSLPSPSPWRSISRSGASGASAVYAASGEGERCVAPEGNWMALVRRRASGGA
jgi:hypothetical protein